MTELIGLRFRNEIVDTFAHAKFYYSDIYPIMGIVNDQRPLHLHSEVVDEEIRILGSKLIRKEYSIFNSLGREIWKGTCNETGIIPSASLIEGTYILKLAEGIYYYRFVIY